VCINWTKRFLSCALLSDEEEDQTALFDRCLPAAHDRIKFVYVDLGKDRRKRKRNGLWMHGCVNLFIWVEEDA